MFAFLFKEMTREQKKMWQSLRARRKQMNGGFVVLHEHHWVWPKHSSLTEKIQTSECVGKSMFPSIHFEDMNTHWYPITPHENGRATNCRGNWSFFGGIRFPSKCSAASHLLYFAKVVAISNMWSFQISTDWPINPHMQQKQRFEEK